MTGSQDLPYQCGRKRAEACAISDSTRTVSRDIGNILITENKHLTSKWLHSGKHHGTKTEYCKQSQEFPKREGGAWQGLSSLPLHNIVISSGGSMCGKKPLERWLGHSLWLPAPTKSLPYDVQPSKHGFFFLFKMFPFLFIKYLAIILKLNKSPKHWGLTLSPLNPYCSWPTLVSSSLCFWSLYSFACILLGCIHFKSCVPTLYSLM